MQLRSLLPNLAWCSASRPGHRGFVRSLRDPGRAQREILLGIVQRNADSAFGRAHGFAGIRSVRDFQQRVPLRAYEEFEPFVRRIRAGEPRVLTTEPVSRLIPSSGSTAAAKLVPHTAGLQREFNRAIGPWIVDLYRQRPSLMAGPAYWSITPAMHPPDANSQIPIGFEDDTNYLGGRWKRVVDATMAVPSSVSRLTDTRAFQRETLRALLRARELRLISVWHPSFLCLLLDHMESTWEELLAGLGDSPRATALRHCDPRDRRAIWPRLGLISCWGDAHAAMHVPELRRRFPGVAIQPKGLLATEAFVSIPFRERMPVAIRSHFFEFLDERGSAHLAHELTEGATYSAVVTTGGGLYRYRLRDLVQVTGFVDATPSIRFLGPEDSISDLRGEKLSEGFVAQTLRDLFARCRWQPRFALLAPDGGNAYTLFVEDVPATGLRLDDALRQNPHYDLCRSLGQLAPARIFVVSHDAQRRYLERCQRVGQRLGNIKPRALSRLDGWADVFAGSYLAPDHADGSNRSLVM